MAFSTHDIVSDSPTNNHCVWNNLAGRYKNGTDRFLQPTFSEGNTKITAHSDEVTHAIGTIASSQKHYAEFIVDGGTSPITGVGVVSSEWDKSNLQSYIYQFEGAIYAAEGTLYSHTTTDTTPDAITTSFRVGIEVDFGANEVAFFKVELDGNGNVTRTQQGSTITTNIDFKGSGSFAASLHNDTEYIEAYFIEDDWWGTPNPGYTALCTANLTDFTPDVDDDTPQDYFKSVIWSGTTYANATVPVGFTPDFVWAKSTNTSGNHRLVDSVRGGNGSLMYELSSNDTGGNGTDSAITGLSNNGINLSSGNFGAVSGQDIVAWCWKAGGPPSGSTSTTGSAKRINTSGTQDDTSCSALATAATNAGASNVITPTLMSINQAAGFSIVKYNGSGTLDDVNYSIPHGLSNALDVVIVKNLDLGSQSAGITWPVLFTNIGSFPGLDGTQGVVATHMDNWGGSYPNANTFSVERPLISSTTNRYRTLGAYNYIAYCWHSVEGYSKFGSYTGNGSADGMFVYCGFRPEFVICKCSSDITTTYTSWAMYDNARDSSNAMNKVLYANKSINEGYRGDASTAATDIYIDFLSNGFKARSIKEEINDGSETNITYIFMAFAEQPFKFSNAR